MMGNKVLSVVGIMVLAVIPSFVADAADLWRAPFDTAGTNKTLPESTLSLNDVMALVAAENQTLRSLAFQRKAADGKLEQAGLWSNPELDIGLEEFGWDAPGVRESEFSISLSQEFEFFGQRGARKNLARAGIDAVRWETRLVAFDLYIETERRFFTLAHGQEQVLLCQASVELAKEVVRNTEFRLDQGAALQSELLLAQLEEQRAMLALDQANQNVDALRAALALLWRGSPSDLVVSTNTESCPTESVDELLLSSNQPDSSRSVLHLRHASEVLSAERKLVGVEARPTVTLRGGFKRFELSGDKSFVFGVSLPIPFLNRNQGARASLDAELGSIAHQIDQAESEAGAILRASISRLKRLVSRHCTLDSTVLPTAQGAYTRLLSEYEAGRLPYAQFLEARRAVNDLSFEHNDLLLAIQQQIIAIESTTGVVLRTDKKE